MRRSRGRAHAKTARHVEVILRSARLGSARPERHPASGEVGDLRTTSCSLKSKCRAASWPGLLLLGGELHQRARHAIGDIAGAGREHERPTTDSLCSSEE